MKLSADIVNASLVHPTASGRTTRWNVVYKLLMGENIARVKVKDVRRDDELHVRD